MSGAVAVYVYIFVWFWFWFVGVVRFGVICSSLSVGASVRFLEIQYVYLEKQKGLLPWLLGTDRREVFRHEAVLVHFHDRRPHEPAVAHALLDTLERLVLEHVLEDLLEATGSLDLVEPFDGDVHDGLDAVDHVLLEETHHQVLLLPHDGQNDVDLFHELTRTLEKTRKTRVSSTNEVCGNWSFLN